jgi:hypothetical protein
MTDQLRLSSYEIRSSREKKGNHRGRSSNVSITTACSLETGGHMLELKIGSAWSLLVCRLKEGK